MYAELNRAKLAWFVVTGALLAVAIVFFAMAFVTHDQRSALIGLVLGVFGFPAWAMAATRWEEADEAKLAESSS